MADLVEFLRARLDEDERLARDEEAYRSKLRAVPGVTYVTPPFFDEGTPGHPARVLAEVEAKRQIIRDHQKLPLRLICKTCVTWIDDEIPERRIYPCRTLRMLACTYATHPGYQEEWRP